MTRMGCLPSKSDLLAARKQWSSAWVWLPRDARSATGRQGCIFVRGFKGDFDRECDDAPFPH